MIDLPKWAFDKEYATEWRREVAWLKSRGIEPTFVKKTQLGVRRWKYTKTAELFAALAVFYKAVADEKAAALEEEDDTL